MKHYWNICIDLIFSKRIDEDEFLTEEETELRKEYNKYLMLRVSELMIGMIYKVREYNEEKIKKRTIAMIH